MLLPEGPCDTVNLNMRWGRMIGALLGLSVVAGAQVRPDEQEEASAWPAHYGSHHALLIGVSKYDTRAGVKDLDNAVADVNALEKHLKGVLKWPDKHVEVLRNSEVTITGIRNALARFRTLGEGDSLLIWYAGHGMVSAPRGIREPQWSWIMLRRIEDGLQWGHLGPSWTRSARSTCCWFSDSCYAGVRTKIDPSETVTAAKMRGYNDAESRQIITSGDGKPVGDQGAYESTGRRSPFAGAFLQALEAMTGDSPPQTAWQIFQVAQMRTKQESEGKQIPRCAYLDSHGRQSEGQFIFVNPGFLTSETERRKPASHESFNYKTYEDDYEITRPKPGLPVYTHKKIERENDASPMVLIPRTYVPRENGTDKFVRPFLIDVREVTVGQFKRFLAGNERRGTRYLNVPELRRR